MKFINRAALIVAILLVSVAAMAQIRMNISPKFILLGRDNVKKDLALNADQTKKIKALLDTVMKDDGNGHLMMNITPDTSMDELESGVAKVLSGPQNKRLYEIWLQTQGGMALADPHIAKELGLTKDQNQKVQDIQADMQQEIMNKAQASGGRLRLDPSFKEGFAKQMLGVLTAGQKAKLEKMQGKKLV